MPRSRRYKRLEKDTVNSLTHFIAQAARGAGRAVSRFFAVCDRKITIMIVPHSQDRVFNVQTNVFAIVFGAVIFCGILASFFYFNKQAISSSLEISRLTEENRDTLASLDELMDENENLLQTAKRFQSSLTQSLSLLGIAQPAGTSAGDTAGSDLSSLFSTRDIASGSLQETGDIKQLTSYLEGAIQPIEQIGRMLETQETLFSDIPSIWPLKNGVGHISMEFGQNVHPITGQWYIHKGLDFSTWRQGDPIVATANGQVVTVTYDSGFGNYVIIQHKHGFYTRYAHMSAVYVKKGQFVSQHDVIGAIGNTGLSTGPHLHYEVHIGSDVVDPAKYINVRTDQ
ncbi:MAG TPA: M23 family metallopeptidase [Candidatus Treponema faecavium]|nr:M23 family metallopeptidase [Candidatus Treponema faecavium]